MEQTQGIRMSRLKGRLRAWLSKPANIILLVFLVSLVVLTLYPLLSMLVETVTIHTGREARSAKLAAGSLSLYHFQRLFTTAENDYSYRKDPLKREDSRYLHRGTMDWDKAAKRTEEGTPEGAVFSAIRRMETLRGQLAVFDADADVWVLETGNDHILGIGRYCRKLQLLALFNFGAEDATAWLKDEKEYTDLMTDETSDAGAVKVRAGNFRWLLHRFE